VSEVPELANPGRGVTIIKTDETHPVVGFGIGTRKDRVMLVVETDGGKEISIGPERLSVTARGGKGHGLMRKAKVVRVSPPAPPALPTLLN
jgi:DNA gyrase subunit A